MAHLAEDTSDTTSMEFVGRPTPLGERLQTAIDGDLVDIDKTQCVGLGHDITIIRAEESGVDLDEHSHLPSNCIYFMPELGFHISHGDTASLERMTSLFLKMCRTISHNKYSIIYGLSKYSLYSQGKMFRILQRILPRRYKKNLSRIYILHPTTKFRACFKVSKLFFEDKIAEKVTFVSNIAQLQAVLSPLALKLPPALLQLEDAAQPHFSRPLPPMKPLEALFDEQLGAPPFIAQCLSFLREHGMQREGLFRVPGDQTVLTLCPRRFRDKRCAHILFVDTFRELTLGDIHPTLSTSVSSPEDREEEGGGAGSGSGRGEGHTNATVVVDDVDAVAQLFKAYLRELPDAVITRQAYKEVVIKMQNFKTERREAAAAAASDREDSQNLPPPPPLPLTSSTSTASSTSSSSSSSSSDVLTELVVSEPVNEESVLGDALENVLQSHLPASHWRTLQMILTFLADIAVESQINKMSPDNIAVVFAPTLLHIDMSTPASAMESLPICQKLVRVLLLRKMEAHMAERMSPKISFTRFA